MTNKFNVLNQIAKLPTISKTSNRKHCKLSKFSKHCDKKILSFSECDDDHAKRCLSNCNIRNNLQNAVSLKKDLHLSDKFMNLIMKKLFKKTKKRRVLSEERQLPKQNQSILNHINMIKDQEYEQFVQKIGNKVNTAKNFKMYGLQSNRRLILKITQGRIDRFPECNDSSINKVFSCKSFNSSNLNSTNDSSQPRRRLSNEKCDFASDCFAKTISRNCFSPDSRATYNRDMMSL